jgi:hypothetical protein
MAQWRPSYIESYRNQRTKAEEKAASSGANSSAAKSHLQRIIALGEINLGWRNGGIVASA